MKNSRAKTICCLMFIFGLVVFIYLALWYEYSAFCFLFIQPSGFGHPVLVVWFRPSDPAYSMICETFEILI